MPSRRSRKSERPAAAKSVRAARFRMTCPDILEHQALGKDWATGLLLLVCHLAELALMGPSSWATAPSRSMKSPA